MHGAAPRIVAGLQSREQRPGRSDRDRHAPERRREHDEPDHQRPPRHRRQRAESGERVQDARGRQQVEQPAHPGEDEQRHPHERLGPLRRARRGLGPVEPCGLLAVEEGAERLRHRTQPRDVVDVGDGELGHLGADARHQLGGGERPAAQIEEVRLAVGHRNPQHRLPLLGQPGLRGAETGDRHLHAGQRPRQRGAVHLAGCAHRQVVDHREQRDDRGRQALGEHRPGRCAIEAAVGVLHGEIADEHGDSGIRRAHGGGRAGDAGKLLQRRLHLTELDPPAADLDLVVGATLEDETLRVEPDEIAGTIGPIPAERRHRRVLLEILRGVQVTCEPHAPDDQLADVAGVHAAPVRVHDGERPAVQRQADADRSAGVQRRGARDDGGLGGAIRVPHLAAVGHEPRGQLRRHGLAAEDQQTDVLDRLSGPHGGQRRDRRDDADPLPDEPRGEILAGTHEGAGRRHEARAVAPCEPHLLARRVERDRQPGEHAVARPDRGVLQEQARLRVHERRGGPMRHGDPLGDPGGPGGEDDPGVVVDAGRRDGDRCVGARMRRRAVEQGRIPCLDVLGGRRHVRAARTDDAAHAGLAEDEAGAFVRVVGVDRDVGGPDGQHAEDRDVQLLRAGRHPDAHAVAATHTGVVQPRRRPHDVGHELPVAEGAGAVVDRGCLGVPAGRLPEDVDERARRGCERGTVEHLLRLRAVHHGAYRSGEG